MKEPRVERDVNETDQNSHVADGNGNARGAMVRRPRSQTDDEIRFADSQHLSIAEMARDVQGVLGPRLTALVVGTGAGGDVAKWARGEETPSVEQARHLRDAFRVARLLLQAESPRAVRSWFLGMNPDLDDRAPALMIADEPELVVEAAQIFLATG